MAHDVFVSYSEKDKPVADALVAGLEQAGVRCWVAPRDVLAGTSWGGAIVNAIAESRAMVLVLSADSNASVQVVREVELAVAGGVIVVPFRIEAVKPTGAMAYFLAPQHWLDALTPPLEGHIERLCATLGALLGTAPAVEAAAGEAAAGSLRPTPSATPSPRVVSWYRRPLVLGLAAGAVVAAVAALVVFLVAGGKGPATTLAASTSATTTTAPTTTTTTTAPITTTALPGSAWTRAADVDAVFVGGGDQWMTSVVMGGPGVVAVGYDGSGGDQDAAVWTSPDGLVWSRVPHDEVVFGGSWGQWVNELVDGGPGLVAVGADESGGDQDAVVWTSADGLVWSRVPDDEAVFGGGWHQAMTAVVVGGPGLVAVGYDSSGEEEDAAVWTSADGLVWSRVPHDEAIFGGSGNQEMWAVAVSGRGFVAVGSDASGEEEEDAAVWTSADGLVWSRVPHDEAILGGSGKQEMEAVAVGGPGLVAVGADESGGDFDAAVWTSADGLVWSQVPHDEAIFGGPDHQILWTVTVGGPGLVAAGVDAGGGDDEDAAVWASPDGLVWSRVPHDEAAFGGPGFEIMWDVKVGGPGLVAVGCGSLDAVADFDAAVWVSAVDSAP